MKSTLFEVISYCDKRKVVDIQAHEPLSTAFLFMQESGISSLAVYGAPGHFYSSSDMSLSVHNDKQYIGLISLADCVAYLLTDENTIDKPCLNVIGATNESMSLWILKSSDLLFNCLEPFAKGLHACLVSGWGDDLYFLSQFDIVRYLYHHLNDVNLFNTTPASLTLEECFHFKQETNAITVSLSDSVPDALSIMIEHSRRSVGILNQAGCLVDFFSLDLKLLLAWTSEKHLLNAIADLKTTSIEGFLISSQSGRKPGVFLLPTSSLQDAIESALNGHVHHVWVVEDIAKSLRKPLGVVSFSNIVSKLRDLIVAHCE